MPRSDENINGDALVREVIRQIACAAPPPPDWSSMRQLERPDDVAARVSGSHLALVAAVAALVVSGLWFFARPHLDDELPADVPVETIQPVDTYSRWTAMASTAEVHLCLSRAIDALSNQFATELTAATNEQPELFDPAQLRINLHRATVRPLRALMEHPDAPSAVADDLRTLVGVHDAAELGQFSVDGSLSPDIERLEADAAAARLVSTSLLPDPDRCWLERRVGAAVMADFVRQAEPIGAARCIAWAQFESAAAATSIDVAGFPLALETARTVNRWFDPVPTPLIEFDRAIAAAEPEDDVARQAALEAARGAVDLTDLGIKGCPLLTEADTSAIQRPGLTSVSSL